MRLTRNDIRYIEASCRGIMEKLGYGTYENHKVGPEILDIDMDKLWNTWFLEDEKHNSPKLVEGEEMTIKKNQNPLRYY